MTHTDVLIVGAGPTGLTAAMLLAQYGVQFRIIDKKSGPTRESRAIGVQPHTLELWDKFGLADVAIQNGQALKSLYMLIPSKRGKDHATISPFQMLSQDGNNFTPYPFMLIYEQYKTERMLVDALASQKQQVEWNTQIKQFHQDDDGVDVVFQQSNGNEEVIRASWVLAADGAHSFVRSVLDIPFEGKTYDESLFVADVDMAWAFDRDKFYADLSGLGFLAFFPMRGDGYSQTQYRIIGTVSAEMNASEIITASDLQRYLDQYCCTRTQVQAVHWVSKYRISRRITQQFRLNRVFLMGDSAHIHSPSGGQGMNTGIQDAWNIAWKLGLVVLGDAKPDLLDSYQPERIPVARAILNGSDKGFTTFTSHKLPWKWLRPLLTPLIPRVVRRFNLGAILFRYTSQTWINYRKSPNAGGDRAAKMAQPGDRAPYARFDTGSLAGQSIYSTMTGSDHHLLLFVKADALSAVQREQIETLLAKYRVCIQIQVIDGQQPTLYTAYDVTSPTAFLIRPDGHIGWRGALDHLHDLEAYLQRWYVEGEKEEKSSASESEQAPETRHAIYTTVP